MNAAQESKITELGSECVNQAIDAKGERGERFLWRDIESVELVINKINELAVSKPIKQQIFDNFLPEFSTEVEPYYYGD